MRLCFLKLKSLKGSAAGEDSGRGPVTAPGGAGTASAAREWQRLCHGTVGFREEHGIRVFRESTAMVMWHKCQVWLLFASRRNADLVLQMIDSWEMETPDREGSRPRAQLWQASHTFSCLDWRLCFEAHFMIAWNHSQSVLTWKQLKDHLMPTLQPWAEPPPIKTVIPYATWPGTIPGMEILARYFYGFCPTAFIEGLDWDFTALIFGKGLLISRLNLFADKLYLLHLCLVCSLALHTSELIDVICFYLSVHLLTEIIHAEEDSHAQREVILTSLKGLNNYSWSECDQALGLLTNSIIYS